MTVVQLIGVFLISLVVMELTSKGTRTLDIVLSLVITLSVKLIVG